MLMALTPMPGCDGRSMAVVMAILGEERAEAAVAPGGESSNLTL